MREEGGVLALYRGMIPTAVGVAPYVGINFAAYEALRGVITPPEKNTVVRKLACGALAGKSLDDLQVMTRSQLSFLRPNRGDFADADISIRCVTPEDASSRNGHGSWTTIQWCPACVGYDRQE